MHRTIEQVIRTHIDTQPMHTWLDSIPYVELAINTTPSATTNKTPYELVYGQNIAMPIDHAVQQPVTTSAS